MSNCILKVKLNEYYPKIDNIPYKHYVCLIIYNNYYTKIKLSDKKDKFFQHKLRITNNSYDILLKIKLLDSLQSSIIGNGDLLIPFIKLKQMINNYNNYLSYHQILNVKLESIMIVKTLNKNMNITNIYLDLIIELYSIDKYSSLLKNGFYYYKSHNYKGKKPIRGVIQLDNSKKYNQYTSYNNIHDFDNSYKVEHSDINNLNYISTDSNNNYNNYNLKNKPYKNIKLNPPGIPLTINNNKNNQLKYYFLNDATRNKITHNPYILTENVDDNNYNNLELNFNNMTNNTNNNINYEDTFFNNENSTFTKTNNNFYINKRHNKNFPYFLSPINNNNDNNDTNDNNDNNIKYHHNYNFSQTFDRSSLSSSTLNSKKEMSSVLNYFSHVKPFTKTNFKKNSFFALKKYGKFNRRKEANNNTENNNNKIEKKKEIVINKDIKELKNVQKEFNNNENLNFNQDTIKEEIIKFLNEHIILNKEIKQKMKNINNLEKKNLLKKEQYNSELKKKNILINKDNLRQIKNIIHANINSKINQNIYLNLKKIKNEELSIIDKIFHDNKINKLKKMAQEKLEQQKKIHALLNIIRDLIKNYDNLSHLYNDDENKKILFKSLLLRYGIREKEEDKNKNLIEKYNELKQSIYAEKNKMIMDVKKKEMEYDLYKNAIEEASEEGGSIISGRKSRPFAIKKLSWCSEDSVMKEKEKHQNDYKTSKHKRGSVFSQASFDNDNDDVKREIIFIEEEGENKNNNNSSFSEEEEIHKDQNDKL